MESFKGINQRNTGGNNQRYHRRRFLRDCAKSTHSHSCKSIQPNLDSLHPCTPPNIFLDYQIELIFEQVTILLVFQRQTTFQMGNVFRFHYPSSIT
ncbi:MAG: hypothetical protein CMJ77_07140 [Planctomycetaceae bacterium]|nr:hypothetical protein [Planctomycetaceae bacterium]